VGARVSLFREPDAGKLPVRFDEREQETELGQTGLRGRGESPVTSPPGDYFYCACSRLYSGLHSSTKKRRLFVNPLHQWCLKKRLVRSKMFLEIGLPRKPPVRIRPDQLDGGK